MASCKGGGSTFLSMSQSADMHRCLVCPLGTILRRKYGKTTHLWVCCHLAFMGVSGHKHRIRTSGRASAVPTVSSKAVACQRNSRLPADGRNQCAGDDSAGHPGQRPHATAAVSDDPRTDRLLLLGHPSHLILRRYLTVWRHHLMNLCARCQMHVRGVPSGLIIVRTLLEGAMI